MTPNSESRFLRHRTTLRDAGRGRGCGYKWRCTCLPIAPDKLHVVLASVGDGKGDGG